MINCKRHTIFVLDHDPSHVERFKKVFNQWPHLVYYCRSLDEIKAILQGVLADILICNLRVPGLIEEDFFRHAQKTCPHAIRMAFGEEDDTVVLMKLVADGKVHRYFNFPWERSEEVSIITNDLHTRSRIRIRKCWRFLQEHTGVPTLPDVARELEEILADSDYEIEDVVQVLKKDPLIAARLLQVVNSAAFAKVCEIKDLHHAVTYLGVTATRKVLLFICTTKFFLYPRKHHRTALQIIRHCLHSSRLAGIIAEEILPGQERVVATASLLHDIGKLVLLSSMADKRFASISLPDDFRFNANSFEERTFGLRHQELGSSLMLWWNLPLAIVESVANVHMDINGLDGVARCVAIADRCLKSAETGNEFPDLEALRPYLPVDEWLGLAEKIITT